MSCSIRGRPPWMEGQLPPWDIGPGPLPATVWDECRAPGATYSASIVDYLGRRYVGITLVAAPLPKEVLAAGHVGWLKGPVETLTSRERVS
eukprot:145728-Heterocapsa_arctica.AAC.1